MMPETDGASGVGGTAEIPDWMKRMYGAGTEGEGSPERLFRSENPDHVTLGARLLMGREMRLWIPELASPNAYAIEFDIRALLSRSRAHGLVLGLIGKEPKTDAEARTWEEMALVCERAAFEVAAFKDIMAHVDEEKRLRDDLETIMFKRFVSPGKSELSAEALKIAFEAGPTWEGEADFGEKVAVALEAFVKIGRGEAVVRFDADADMKVPLFRREVRVKSGERGIVGTFPNIWALRENMDLLRMAMEKVVVPDVAKIRKAGVKKSIYEQRMGREDDDNAAMYAYILFKALKLNLKFGLGSRGIGAGLDPADVTAEDVQLYDLAGNDDRLKMLAAVRAAREHGLTYNEKTKKFEGSREHRRVAGSMMAIYGCFPSMIATIPEVIGTSAKAIKERVNGGAWGDIAGGRVVKTSVYDACFARKTSCIRRVTGRGGERADFIEYELEGKSIREVWHGVSGVKEAVDSEGRPVTRKIKDNSGKEVSVPALEVMREVDQDAPEINFGLMGLYAYRVWEKMIETDFSQQYEGILAIGTKDGFLIKMNKYLDVFLGFLGSAYGFDVALTRKLNDYVRVAYLAGVLRAVTSGVLDDSDPAKAAQVIGAAAGTDRRSRIANVINAARVVGFLPNDEKRQGAVYDWVGKMMHYVVEQGDPVTPFDLKEGGDKAERLGLGFSDAELRMLSSLYPFVAYP